MCYAYNPAASSTTFNAAIGRPTGIGVDQSAFHQTMKDNSAAYRAAIAEWDAGGNVGPKPINANVTLMKTGVAAVQANRAAQRGMAGGRGGGAAAIGRFGG